MAGEAEVLAAVALAVGSLPGVRVFRNTVGTGWSGEVVSNERGLLTLRRPRFVRYGLAPGSADLVGWQSVVVRPEHVGMRLARFVSLETKGPGGSPDPDQLTWLARTTEAGAAAAVVYSTTQALTALRAGNF